MYMDTKQVYEYIIKIQSIAKIGLKFSKDPYAISNYREINDISLKFLEDFVNVKFDRPNYFQRDIYPTPNISVRTVILNEDKDKVLLVREVKDKSYSLPGGWADLYESASQAAIKECIQEAGANCEIIRLVGLLHKRPNKPTSVPEYIAVFEGKLNGELCEHEYETDEVKWFDVNDLPINVSKVYIDEMKRMIDATIKGKTIFD